MKSFVSALGMATAAFAVATSAGAADLPSRKAAPVEYVRVCSAYGAGFFYIPGTDTCLRVGGRVRAEYTVGSRFGDTNDSYGTRARGRLNIDARTATAYGTLRTFFRYELTNSTSFYNNTTSYGGNQGIVGPGNARASDRPTRFADAFGNSTASLVDLAFIQFGPITAGRAQSFFDFYANDLSFSTIRTADSRLNLLAYTATFGSGFSATISLEDRISGTGGRENGVVSPGSTAFLNGQNFPDVVASLRVDQGWGSAQLSGAVTQRDVNMNGLANAGVILRNSDEWGWAVQGGVKINLPMLAAGDHLFLQAAYADGALGYLGWGGQIGPGRLGSGVAGGSTLAIADVSVDAQFTGRTSAMLSYRRGTGASVQSASGYISDSVNLRITQMVGSSVRPWRVTVGGTYGGNSYETGTSAGTRNDYLNLNCGLSYQPKEWLLFGLNYNFSKHFAGSSSRVDYDVNRVSLIATVGY